MILHYFLRAEEKTDHDLWFLENSDSDVEEGNESMILPETISITVSVFLSLSD